MAAYMLVQNTITDEQQFGTYRQAVLTLIEKFGGRHVRGGPVELLYGRQDERRLAKNDLVVDGVMQRSDVGDCRVPWS